MNTRERNLIMIYLYMEKKYKPKHLAEKFNLTVGTVKNYLYYLKRSETLQNDILLGEQLFLKEEEEKILEENHRRFLIQITSGTLKYVACAYIVRFNSSQGIITKVGYTTNFKQRKYQLERKYGIIEPLDFYCFDNEEDGYMMEILLHKYFKEKEMKNFIPQDRFIGDVYDRKEDKPILSKVAEELKNKKWF